MNIVCISTAQRPELLEQTLITLQENAHRPMDHTLTLVLDNPDVDPPLAGLPDNVTLIVNGRCEGASASRNIGASSIPKYKRQPRVMFIDDDTYAVKDWDDAIDRRLDVLPTLFNGRWVLSGYSHPFNHHTVQLAGAKTWKAAVLSTVHIAMPWNIWDDVGCWTEPGGPGGSEDVDWCQRAGKRGVQFGVTDPEVIIHCGLRSSNGQPIPGHGLMIEKNVQLFDKYNLTGKAVMAV